MIKFISIIVAFLMIQVGLMTYFDVHGNQNEEKARCDLLVMYSASWCPACERARNSFRQAGIRFREHVVDKNPTINARFERKARAENVRIAYPTYEVNGKLLAKNYHIPYLNQTYDLCKTR